MQLVRKTFFPFLRAGNWVGEDGPDEADFVFFRRHSLSPLIDLFSFFFVGIFSSVVGMFFWSRDSPRTLGLLKPLAVLGGFVLFWLGEFIFCFWRTGGIPPPLTLVVSTL